jgi:DNA gyrase/topoisomerase IV subunit B
MQRRVIINDIIRVSHLRLAKYVIRRFQMVYDTNSIETLEVLKHIRLRPGMYISGTGVEGVQHLFHEALDNAVDEHISGYCNTIKVTLDQKLNQITVLDDGRGIPCGHNNKLGMDTLTAVFCQSFTGGKFNKKVYNTSGGQNGIGNKIINAMSHKLEVTVYHDDKKYKQQFTRGVQATGVLSFPNDTKITHGTEVTFTPDDQIFGSTQFDKDLIINKLFDVACLCSKITIEFDGVTYTKQSLGDILTKMLSGTEEFDPRFEFSDKELSVAFSFIKSTNSFIKSYVNTINTVDNGSHVDAVIDAILVALKKITGKSFTRKQVVDGFAMAISAFVHEPCFTPDTKISLLNGTEVEIQSLVGLREFYVYSRDLFTGNIVPGRAHSCRKTGTKPILKITLDNGEVIRCTENHLFLLKSGNRYKRADELVVGESLSPLYRQIDKNGYDEYLDNDGVYRETHRMTYHYKYGKSIYKMEMAHHKDFHKRNNEPKNILAINPQEHIRYHSRHSKRLMKILCIEGRHGWQSDKSKLRVSVMNQSVEARQRNSILLTRRNIELNPMLSTDIKKRMVDTRVFNGSYLEHSRKLLSGETKHPMSDPEVVRRFIESNEENGNYDNFRSKAKEYSRKGLHARNHKGIPYDTCPKCNLVAVNHKVISVESAGYSDVYDFTVDTHHNFALSAGVFVHNCLIGQHKGKFTDKNAHTVMMQKLAGPITDYFTVNTHIVQVIVDKIMNQEKLISQIEINNVVKSIKKARRENQLPASLSVAHDCKPQDRELILVEGTSAGGCCAGETMVVLEDNTLFRLDGLVDGFQPDKYFVQSVENNAIVNRLVLNAFKTKTTTDCTRLIFENGKELVCTRDHPILLKSGLYKQAGDLTLEDEVWDWSSVKSAVK